MSDRRDLRVAFVGDSFVAGIGDPGGSGWVGRVVAAAAASGKVFTAHNLGIGGDTSADVLRRWETQVLLLLGGDADRRVVLSFGANDATFEGARTRVDERASVANLEQLLDRAQELGFGVFFVGPPPYGDELQHERISELSARLVGVAAARAVPYVDLIEAVGSSTIWRAEADAGDGAHPAAGGYELLAAVIGEPLLRWLGTPLR